MTPALVLEALRAYQPLEVPAAGARAAAVLVPLQCNDHGDMEILLTRRTEHPRDPHSGQVSFPGGRCEPQDRDREATALREAGEELGIPRHAVDLVGRLDEMVTVTGFHVVPVVGQLADGVTLSPSVDEVARVFSVPVSELLREERWEHRLHEWRGSQVKVWHFPFADEDVWGATAYMLRGMIRVVRNVV